MWERLSPVRARPAQPQGKPGAAREQVPPRSRGAAARRAACRRLAGTLVTWQVPGGGSARWEPALGLQGPGIAPSPCHPECDGWGAHSRGRDGTAGSRWRWHLLPPSGSPGPWLTAGSSRIPWVVLKNSGTGSPRLGPCQGLSPRQAWGRGPSVCLWVLGAHGASAP